METPQNIIGSSRNTVATHTQTRTTFIYLKIAGWIDQCLSAQQYLIYVFGIVIWKFFLLLLLLRLFDSHIFNYTTKWHILNGSVHDLIIFSNGRRKQKKNKSSCRCRRSGVYVSLNMIIQCESMEKLIICHYPRIG